MPLKSSKSEQSKLTTEKDTLYREYYRLKDEVRDVEIIKRDVEQVVRRNEQDISITKDKGMEL